MYEQLEISPHGQAVKTLPSHGRNRSSILLGGTIKNTQPLGCVFFIYSPRENANTFARLYLYFCKTQKQKSSYQATERCVGTSVSEYSPCDTLYKFS